MMLLQNRSYFTKTYLPYNPLMQACWSRVILLSLLSAVRKKQTFFPIVNNFDLLKLNITQKSLEKLVLNLREETSYLYQLLVKYIHA